MRWVSPSAGKLCKRWPSLGRIWSQPSPSQLQVPARKRSRVARETCRPIPNEKSATWGLSVTSALTSKMIPWHFNPKFYRENGDVVMALANAVWSGQSTVEVFRCHEDARLTWDTLVKAAEIKVPSLILCGADDDVSRRGSTPVGTARRLAELTPGCELFLIPNVKHMTFWDGTGGLAALENFLVRHPIGASR